MTTAIGLHPDFNVVLKSLISLDYDAIEAYQAAIDRLDNWAYKDALAGFMADHRRHTQELSEVAVRMNLEPPTGPDVKVLMAKGKVLMADLIGDKAILIAMKTNEEDTNTAYERASRHPGLPEQAQAIIQRALADERRHRAWLVDTLDKLGKEAA